MAKHVVLADAEIARLRQALTKIAGLKRDVNDCPFDPVEPEINLAVDAAKEALKEFPSLKDKKPKVCPHCGSDHVIMFDSDNDYCSECNKWFPAL